MSGPMVVQQTVEHNKPQYDRPRYYRSYSTEHRLPTRATTTSDNDLFCEQRANGKHFITSSILGGNRIRSQRTTYFCWIAGLVKQPR